MPSPITTFAATALALTIGGAFLVASNFDEPPTDLAAAPADFEPVSFTGVFSPGGELREATIETIGNRVVTRGAAWTPYIVTISDDRLDGTLVYAADEDAYTDSGHAVTTVTYRIENDGGAWQGSTVELEIGAATAREQGFEPFLNTVILMGEGGYEGMAALMEQSDGIVRGVLFPVAPPAPSDLPPLPAE